MGVRELGIRKAILDTVEARLRVDEAAQNKEKELEKQTVRYCDILPFITFDTSVH